MSRDVRSCLCLLRSWVVGANWEEKLRDYLRRRGTLFEFQCEFGRVVEACGMPKEYIANNFGCQRVREKLDGFLSKQEKRFLKEKKIDWINYLGAGRQPMKGKQMM